MTNHNRKKISTCMKHLFTYMFMCDNLKKALIVRASSVGKQLKLSYVNEAPIPQRSPEYEIQYKNMSKLMAQ